MPNQITIFTEAHNIACARAKRLLSDLLIRVQGDLGSPEGRAKTETRGFSSPGAAHAVAPTLSLSCYGDPAYVCVFGLPGSGLREEMRRCSDGQAASRLFTGGAFASFGREVRVACGGEEAGQDLRASFRRVHRSPAGRMGGRGENSFLLTDEVVEEEAGKWTLVEISLTDYPERREELLQLSSSFLLPQVFFNNFGVGGWEELQRLEQSGELETLLASSVDNYEYRQAPAVSRSLWEDREVERELRTKYDCLQGPGGGSLPATRPFFDTPLSLYQRSSIAGRVEARRASEENEGRRASTLKQTPSSRFSRRSPRHHTLRLRTASVTAQGPGDRETDGEPRRERLKFSALFGEKKPAEASPPFSEEGGAEETTPAKASSTSVSRWTLSVSRKWVEEEDERRLNSATEKREEPKREGEMRKDEKREEEMRKDEKREEEKREGTKESRNEQEKKREGRREDGRREEEREQKRSSGEEREEGNSKQPEREKEGRRISFRAEHMFGEAEKAPTRRSVSSPHVPWPASCSRLASVTPLDPRVQAPTYSPRKSASKEADELKKRDPFYAGAFFIPASEADVKSGKFSISTDPHTDCKMKKITYAELLKTLRVVLPFADRTAYLRTHKQCFVASEAVDAFCSQLHFPSRDSAVQFGRDLVRHSVIQLSHQDHLVVFADSPSLLCRLQMHQEPFVLNWTVIWTKPVVSSLLGLVRYLYTLFDELEAAHEEAKTSLIDQARVKSDARYLEFQIAVCELQTVDLLNLKSEGVKKAFLLNIYNLLCKHALIELGVPSDSMSRKTFFSSVSYCIGGYRFTLNELENGLLRCNRRACYSLTKPFGFRDQRLQFVLNEFDPRIHFALNFGAKSGPPVRFYEAESIEEELRIAAEAFCESDANVLVDLPGKTLWLSKIFSWYENDFGSTHVKVALFLLPFLHGEKRERLISLLRAAKADVLLPQSSAIDTGPFSRFTGEEERCMRETELPSPASILSSSALASSSAAQASPSRAARVSSAQTVGGEERFVHAPPLHVSSCPSTFHHTLADLHGRQKAGEGEDATAPGPASPGPHMLHANSEREAGFSHATAVPPGGPAASEPAGPGVHPRGRGVPTPGGGSTPGTFFQKLLTRSKTSLTIEGSPLAHAASLFSRSGSSSFLPGSGGATFKVKYLDYDWTPNIVVSHKYRGSWLGDVVGRVQTVLPTQVINMSLHAYGNSPAHAGHDSNRPSLQSEERDDKRGEAQPASTGVDARPHARVSDASTALGPHRKTPPVSTASEKAAERENGHTEGGNTTQRGEKTSEGTREAATHAGAGTEEAENVRGVASAGKKKKGDRKRRSNAEKLRGKKGEKREEEGEGVKREERSVPGRSGFLKGRSKGAPGGRGRDAGDAAREKAGETGELAKSEESSSEGIVLGCATPAEFQQKKKGRPRQLKEKFHLKTAEKK
ncbi:dishevelled/Egl-10/leckstrin domain protein [Toxoplasma gondii VAND]|uniref:Dishevelled/Egl-10/leckstrin domain protein n=1 Tax=Toxoplasma gondii VAND TaxID=933077 RepID=A0A086Q9X8_TOXGO|nr:dishevelled/Egl-10/leckstrin domain protein [Toxoplasma gondii VAND]